MSNEGKSKLTHPCPEAHQQFGIQVSHHHLIANSYSEVSDIYEQGRNYIKEQYQELYIYEQWQKLHINEQ